MKNSNLIFLAFLGLVNTLTGQSNLASVNKIQGFYVFVDSQPIAEYDVIGEVVLDSWIYRDRDVRISGGQYQPVRDYLINSARRANNSADGLIMTLVNDGTNRAVIIKFKENQKNIGTAKVNQYQGLYLFVDANPVSPTNYIGSNTKIFDFGSYEYSAIRDKFIKRTKKDFPEAQCIIFKFVSGGTDVADAFKYEN